MELNRKQLKELILEEMNKLEEVEGEIPPPIKPPTGGSVAATKTPGAAPAEPGADPGQMPPDVERDLKIGFATKFDELVKANINTLPEATAFISAMINLMEKVPPAVIARALRQELTNRQKAATS